MYRVGVLTLLIASLAVVGPAAGQELDCRVQIDDSQLSGSDFEFLSDLQRQVQEYLNDRSWTDDEFRPHERISCSMQIIFLEAMSLSQFRTRVIVTSRRPIYNTSQSSMVLRVNDPEWRFEYSRGRSLNFDLQQFDPLTSVLDFYAYLILGYDYDTFSELGGTSYFKQARAIVERAESGAPGWSSVGTQRTRAQLISNVLDQRHQPLRRAYYTYHLEGLDRFVDDPEAARQQILEVLNSLQQLNRDLSRTFAFDLFFATKYQELTALFANSSVSSQAHNILVQIDASHSSEYSTLVE